MHLTYRTILPATAMASLAGPALATTVDLSITLPQIKTAEYHRPYVAAWLEQAGQPTGRTVQVWYQQPRPNAREDGTKWLRDLRGWWRKSGRALDLPANGISGATRAPGTHAVSANVGQLPAGAYELVVEAVREDGNRETVRLPIAWNGKAATKAATAKGTIELGAVSAVVKP
ncbi:DUF2271 domain-containing protein [Sphingomonas naphthae]|uniref:DUF2271 domain-containing protein n=1 Tax=Sphingomonas naphthae TaxID=1813468 RepID=A0ABY7TF55_9SPHN|nr:DUF2271 domain-containing protein [Sphingomonas naphthae]WCT71838.1 DUF2271 domain-containing protein [Sphingomonas naphthae]